MPGCAAGAAHEHERPAEQVKGRDPAPVTLEKQVRSARTRPSLRLSRMLVQSTIVIWFEYDGGRVVAVADLHREVVNDWLRPIGPEVWRHARHVARVRLLDGQLAD